MIKSSALYFVIHENEYMIIKRALRGEFRQLKCLFLNIFNYVVYHLEYTTLIEHYTL